MELYIRKVEKNALSLEVHRAGDVVAMCPDGWEWGSGELGSEEHVIVKVPSADPDDYGYLTSPNPDRVQRRSFRVQLEGLPNPCTVLQLLGALIEVE